MTGEQERLKSAEIKVERLLRSNAELRKLVYLVLQRRAFTLVEVVVILAGVAALLFLLGG